MAEQEHERAPLLSQPPSSPASSTSSSTLELSPPPRPSPPRKPSSLLHWLLRPDIRLTICLSLSLSLGVIGTSILPLPLARLYESVLCRDYYLTHSDLRPHLLHPAPIDEKFCKIPVVQREVAFLLELYDSLAAVASLLTGVFWGVMADRHGRRPILLLAFVGVALSTLWPVAVCLGHEWVPIRAALVGAALQVLGGGETVFLATMFCMCTDAIQQPRRTTVLFYLSAITALATFVSPPLGSWLMNRHLLLPFKISFLLMVLVFLALLCFPETLPASKHKHSHSESPPRSTLQTVALEARESYSLLLQPNLSLCLLTFLFLQIGSTSQAILLPQYASTKFSLALSTTWWVTSLGALTKLAVASTILPALTAIILRTTAVPVLNLNKAIMLVSFALEAIGSLIEWIAPQPAVLMLGIICGGAGQGSMAPLQAISTSFVDREHNARLFATVGTLQALGRIVAGPMASALFAAGLGRGEWMAGIVFVFLAGVFGCAVVCGALVKLPRAAGGRAVV